MKIDYEKSWAWAKKEWPLGVGLLFTLYLLYFHYNFIMSILIGIVITAAVYLKMKTMKGGKETNVEKNKERNTSSGNSSS